MRNTLDAVILLAVIVLTVAFWSPIRIFLAGLFDILGMVFRSVW